MGWTSRLMTSYNVCSLFTSILLKETIEIAVNLITDKYPDLKITRQEFKKLFRCSTSGTIFFKFFMAAFTIRLMELQWAFHWVLYWLPYLWVFMKKMVRSVSILWCFTLLPISWWYYLFNSEQDAYGFFEV